MLGLFVVWLLFGYWAMSVASSRGNSGCFWLGWGVLLGPFAVIAAYMTTGSVCYHCRSTVHKHATRCPKCHMDFVEKKRR